MLMDLDDVESGGPGFALVEEPLSMIRSAECIDDRFPGRLDIIVAVQKEDRRKIA